VQYNGSAWIAILGGTGNTPPTLPTTSNTYWNLLAQGFNTLAATSVTFSPTGNVAATTVQAAIAELDSEKADAAATTSALAGKANTSHTHVISDVTGLQTALDAKAPLASPAFTGSATAVDIAVTGKASQEIDAIGNTSGTITLNLANGNNFSLTLNANSTNTLANPSNLTAGQSGIIFISQDATGSRTLAYGTSWDFPGGTAPTLTTTANAVDAIVYTVRSATSIAAQFIGDIK
jgi:hypothetical protein